MFSTGLATLPVTCILSLTFLPLYSQAKSPLYLLDRNLSLSQDRPRLNASVNKKTVELGFLQISFCNLVVISVLYCRCKSLAEFEIFFSPPYLQIALSSKMSWKT